MTAPTDIVPTQRTAHAATQTLGLGLIAGSLTLIVAIGIALFGGDDLAPFAVVAVLSIVAATVTWRFDRQWARWLGLAATVISLMGFFLAFGVFHPFSPIEFVTGVAYTVGVVMALVAGVRAIHAGRKARKEEPGGARRTRLVTLGIVGVAMIVSVVGFFATRETVDAELAAGATVVDMKNIEFVPENLAVQPGDKLLLTNSDPFTHDFTLDAFDIAVTVGPGSEALVEIPAGTPGTYSFVCTLHSDDGTGMVGTITLEG